MAQVSWLTEADYLEALRLDAALWTRANPVLGLPLHLVRAAEAEAEAHQASRRVGPPRSRPGILSRLVRFLRTLR